MTDVLRPPDLCARLAKHPACRDYVAQHGPPVVVKAHADQLAHFAAADHAKPD